MNTVLNFIFVARNLLFHFFHTAVPCWVAMALVAAILTVRSVAKKQDGNYGTEGMCIGMCFGLLIGTMFENNTGIGISLGMLIGLAAGMGIPKKPGDEK